MQWGKDGERGDVLDANLPVHEHGERLHDSWVLDIAFLFLETDALDGDMFLAGGQEAYFFWNCDVSGLRSYD